MNGSTRSTRLAVLAGGAIGTLLRITLTYLPTLELGGSGPALPVGTLAANLLGAAALGWVAGALGDRRADPRWAPVTGGLLGATTTFSTFAVEAGALLEHDAMVGIVWALGSVASGLALVRLGRGWGAQRQLEAAG